MTMIIKYDIIVVVIIQTVYDNGDSDYGDSDYGCHDNSDNSELDDDG